MTFKETAQSYMMLPILIVGYEELLGQAIKFIQRCDELLGEDRDDFSNNLNLITTSN